MALGWLAIWLWAIPSTQAQSLPNLSVNWLGNHSVRFSWPYTNAGFTLQESSSLKASSAWQPSTLAPSFNSNDFAFSVSSPATNAARYFRLSWPADLRGIYVYSSDVSQISANYAKTLDASLNVPGTDGVVLVIGWSSIEPNMGQYQWTNLDQWVDKAISSGKKIDLTLTAGVNTPSWLFQPAPVGAGARALNFTVSPHSGATGKCDSEIIAPPWDTAFLGRWDSILAALAAHLKSVGTYDAVTLLRLTGINRTTDELRLPAETPQSTGLACVSNAVAFWQTNGYRPSLLLHAWDTITGSFQKSFPDKSFSVAIIPQNAFPPIAEDGSVIRGTVPDQNWPLLSLASQKFPGRLVVQVNYLMPCEAPSPTVIEAAQALGTLAAFQSNNYLGSSGQGAACSGPVTNPTPCTAMTCSGTASAWRKWCTAMATSARSSPS